MSGRKPGRPARGALGWSRADEPRIAGFVGADGRMLPPAAAVGGAWRAMVQAATSLLGAGQRRAAVLESVRDLLQAYQPGLRDELAFPFAMAAVQEAEAAAAERIAEHLQRAGLLVFRDRPARPHST